MLVRVDKEWRVSARSAVVLPVSAREAWGQMRDLPKFISVDPLHTRVRMAPFIGPTPAGCLLTIPHRILGLGPDRSGRVLKWEEGRGFAFSDLSMRGARRGFPHVCFYHVDPIGPRTCRMTIGAKGRWTATWVPRAVVRAWLWWVLSATEGHVAASFRHYRRWRRGNERRSARAPRRVPVTGPDPWG